MSLGNAAGAQFLRFLQLFFGAVIGFLGKNLFLASLVDDLLSRFAFFLVFDLWAIEEVFCDDFLFAEASLGDDLSGADFVGNNILNFDLNWKLHFTSALIIDNFHLDVTISGSFSSETVVLLIDCFSSEAEGADWTGNNLALRDSGGAWANRCHISQFFSRACLFDGVRNFGAQSFLKRSWTIVLHFFLDRPSAGTFHLCFNNFADFFPV